MQPGDIDTVNVLHCRSGFLLRRLDGGHCKYASVAIYRCANAITRRGEAARAGQRGLAGAGGRELIGNAAKGPRQSQSGRCELFPAIRCIKVSAVRQIQEYFLRPGCRLTLSAAGYDDAVAGCELRLPFSTSRRSAEHQESPVSITTTDISTSSPTAFGREPTS
jgi:hypothetical protein